MKKIKFWSVLLFSNLVVFVVLVGLLEVIFEKVIRHQKISSIPLPKVFFPQDSPKALATHVPFYLPPKSFLPVATEFISAPLPIVKEKGHSVRDPDCGGLPRPNSRTRAYKRAPDGQVVYDVLYTIDSFARRVSFKSSRVHPKEFLLFLGCSFTFGEGVSDDETLPSQAAKINSRYHSYSYSFHGWGPGNILRRIQKPNFADEIDETRGKAVYLFIDDHLRRVVGNLSIDMFIRRSDQLPYYFLDGQGNLQTRGFFSDGRGISGHLLSWLAQSSLLQFFNVDYPRTFSEEHFLLFSKIVFEIKKTLQAQLPNVDFYVAFYPEARYSKFLIPLLDEAGIKSLDFSDIDLSEYVKGPTLSKYDRHPSPASYQFIAGLISDALK